MTKLLVLLAALAIGQVRSARLGAVKQPIDHFIPKLEPEEEDLNKLEVASRDDDGPDLVGRNEPLWEEVNEHAEGAILAINAKREASELGDLSHHEVKHAYHLHLGRREGYRICVTVIEEGVTKYVQFDTESNEGMDNSFSGIFNIVPVAILGEAGAAAFKGKNYDGMLDSYPCDAESEGKLLQLSLAKKTSNYATGHIEEMAPYKLVDTFRKPHLKATNIPDSYSFYSEYPECKVPVHNQGTCGSCYAFAMLASIDGRKCKHAIDNGGSYDLSSLEFTSSEQEPLSCATPPNKGWCNGKLPYLPPNGCSGGHGHRVIEYTRDNGLTNEQCFPYVSGGTGSGSDHFDVNDGRVPACSAKKCMADQTSKDISRPKSCSAGDVACIKTAILGGPVYASFEVYSDFFDYPAGSKHIIMGTGTTDNGWHAIFLYGWGEENGVEYWLGQNSWGKGYGDEGSFKIKIGAMHINDGVVWSEPQAGTDVHNGGACIKIREEAGTCSFTNECEGVVTAKYSWLDSAGDCRWIYSSSAAFTPGQVKSAENAFQCAVISEEDKMWVNSVPSSTKSRGGIWPHINGWSCNDIYSFSLKACDILTSDSFKPREWCTSCGGGEKVDIPRPPPMQWKPRPRSFMIADHSDCYPSGNWLGATPSADACAEKCRLSEPNAQRFVWVPHGDGNCKCASGTCSTKSDNYWHKLCATYKYTHGPPTKKGFTMIAEYSDCGHSGWLGAAPSADACAKKCRRRHPNAKRFVWVPRGDKNCKCAPGNCSIESDNYWHRICNTYEYTNGGPASDDMQTDTSDVQEVMPA